MALIKGELQETLACRYHQSRICRRLPKKRMRMRIGSLRLRRWTRKACCRHQCPANFGRFRRRPTSRNPPNRIRCHSNIPPIRHRLTSHPWRRRRELRHLPPRAETPDPPVRCCLLLLLFSLLLPHHIFCHPLLLQARNYTSSNLIRRVISAVVFTGCFNIVFCISSTIFRRFIY